MVSYPERRVRYGVIAMLILVCIAFIDVPARAATCDSHVIDTRVASALGILQRFESSRRVNDVNSLGDLQSAIDTMQSAPDVHALTSENFLAQRRTIVQGWGQILKVIEQSYDPAFNPDNVNDIPTTCVIPPGGFPCTVNPSVIQDPKARAVYVSALQDNALKLKRANYYGRLHVLDMGAMTILEVTLRVFGKWAPNGVGPDFAALDDILRRTTLSDARRKTIDAMFYANARPSGTSSKYALASCSWQP